MIEIINGVNIDWSKFKVEGKEKNLERAKIAYIKFCNEMNEIGFKVSGKYTGNMKKVEIQYILDENIKIIASPNSFKRSYKVIKEIMESKEYKFIKIAKVNINDRGQDLILLMMGKDGIKFELTLRTYKTFMKSKEDTEKFCEDKGYKILSSYIGNQEKILIDFNCGHAPHWAVPLNLKNGAICPKCAKRCPEQAKEEFFNIAEKEGYKILSEYINANTKIEMMCSNNHTFTIAPHTFKSQNIRCPKCSGRCPEQAKEEFFNMIKEIGYKVIGEYTNNSTKVKMECDKGHIFNVAPNTFKSMGTRCPHCKNSKGEKKIVEWCKNNNLEYEVQKDYDFWLKDKKSLRYDVYIPSLNWLIEYDGEFHYMAIKMNKNDTKAEERLKGTQRRDKIKNNFAKYASDYFTRIPYTDFDNIEQILDDKLKEILEYRQAFNEALEEAREHIEAETDYHDFKNYLYSFFE